MISRKIQKMLYFSFLGRIISIVLNFLAIFHRPFIVYGYRNKSSNTFNRNTRISSTALITYKENVEIGDNVWIWHHTIIDGLGGVKIGKGCHIGAWVGIFSHSAHIAIRLLGEKYIYTDIEDRIGYEIKQTIIGEYVFIGSGSIILPGVKIGRGSVVAAGSVVNRDIPEFSIVVGDPAEVRGDVRIWDRAFFNINSVRESYIDKDTLNHYLSMEVGKKDAQGKIT